VPVAGPERSPQPTSAKPMKTLKRLKLRMYSGQTSWPT
jgi:hypothetical protein